MNPGKYRARRIDNNKWVKGWHVVYHKQHFITNFTERASFIAGFERVIPETVGQSTGKKDKNGVEIWKGDFISDPSSRVIYEVYWNQEYGQWYVRRINFTAGVAEGTPLYRFTEGAYYEVFGNRHDKPELLEEQP